MKRIATPVPRGVKMNPNQSRARTPDPCPPSQLTNSPAPPTRSRPNAQCPDASLLEPSFPPLDEWACRTRDTNAHPREPPDGNKDKERPPFRQACPANNARSQSTGSTRKHPSSFPRCRCRHNRRPRQPRTQSKHHLEARVPHQAPDQTPIARSTRHFRECLVEFLFST